MKTFRFFDFPVYNEAKLVYLGVANITRGLKDFTLKDQIKRAVLSIVLNIAEGSAKRSDKEFARFLETSICSANEVIACLDLMKDQKIISEEMYNRFYDKIESIVKQLGGFIKKVRSKD